MLNFNTIDINIVNQILSESKFKRYIVDVIAF